MPSLKKISCLILVGLLCLGQGLSLPLAAMAQTLLTLREGRLLAVEMVDDAQSGSVEAGDEVKFTLLEDVEVHGQIALPKGSTGILKVVAIKKNGIFGKPGLVEFGEGYVKSGMNEVPIALEGSETRKGKGKLGKGLLFLIVGVLFVKGEEGGLEAGQQVNVQITSTQQVPPAG